MQLLGLIKLDQFKKKHADARAALDIWRLEVELANWVGPQDVKNRYPNASFLANNRVIFNIKGNTFRLVVKAKYQNGIEHETNSSHQDRTGLRRRTCTFIGFDG